MQPVSLQSAYPVHISWVFLQGHKRRLSQSPSWSQSVQQSLPSPSLSTVPESPLVKWYGNGFWEICSVTFWGTELRLAATWILAVLKDGCDIGIFPVMRNLPWSPQCFISFSALRSIPSGPVDSCMATWAQELPDCPPLQQVLLLQSHRDLGAQKVKLTSKNWGKKKGTGYLGFFCVLCY